MTALPPSIDRMPDDDPQMDAARLIAFALNSVPYEWWRTHKSEPPLSETSQPVKAVLDVMRIEGYAFVKRGKGSL
jgi:hypothetical protein